MTDASKEKNALDFLDYAAFGRPCFGERVSGDNAIVEERDGFVFLGIVDVLGHGVNANALSQQIEAFLQENWTNDVSETLLKLHECCQGTIGAAVGLAVLNVEQKELFYCGVGNTVIRILGKRSRRLYSTDGIVGSHMRTPVEQKLSLSVSDTLILYTDGIKDRFDLDDYPQIIYESPPVIVRNIVRRFEKVYDDATCIVLRYKK
ncbi:MAG: SpoIIE family protein phosphatase [Cyanobacteria bacterium P01_E01_bin.42]